MFRIKPQSHSVKQCWSVFWIKWICTWLGRARYPIYFLRIHTDSHIIKSRKLRRAMILAVKRIQSSFLTRSIKWKYRALRVKQYLIFSWVWWKVLNSGHLFWMGIFIIVLDVSWQGNILHSLIDEPVLLSVEINNIFLLKQFFIKKHLLTLFSVLMWTSYWNCCLGECELSTFSFCH